MGMRLALRGLDEPQARRLLAEPDSIFVVLGGEVPQVTSSTSKGVFARLFGSTNTVNKALMPPSAEWQLGPIHDMDKAWHGVHWLLTGDVGPAEDKPLESAFLIAGGRDIGDVDVGYGPARLFSPSEVHAIARYLDAQREFDLRSRFDAAAMEEAGVYPSGWSEETRDTASDWLVEAMAHLREYVKACAEKNRALVVALT